MSSTSASTDPAVDAAPAEEIILANCAYLLARACSSPQQVLDEDPMQLRSAIQGADPALAQVGHELTACWTAARAEPEALIQAHARLFVGPFSILVSPYASFYLERDQRLMGEVSQAVAQAYARVRLGPGAGPREAPDHIALEWEFAYYLSHQYLTTGDRSWQRQRRQFHDAHMIQWMPAFAQALARPDRHPFYNAVAAFIQSTLEHTRRSW